MTKLCTTPGLVVDKQADGLHLQAHGVCPCFPFVLLFHLCSGVELSLDCANGQMGYICRHMVFVHPSPLVLKTAIIPLMFWCNVATIVYKLTDRQVTFCRHTVFVPCAKGYCYSIGILLWNGLVRDIDSIWFLQTLVLYICVYVLCVRERDRQTERQREIAIAT